VGCRGVAGFAALLIGCADPVPAVPTWVDDVEPILRGSCFHCHGAVPVGKDAARWDVYDRTDPQLAAMGDFSAYLTTDGKDAAHFVAIQALVDPAQEEARRMPPPPARRLGERERAVLSAWQETGFQRGTRPFNRPPTIAWYPAAPRFIVRDGDGEQVLGKLSCTGGHLLLPRSGIFELTPPLQPPCSAALFDGQDLVASPLVSHRNESGR
jgi:hypothetical protein